MSANKINAFITNYTEVDEKELRDFLENISFVPDEDWGGFSIGDHECIQEIGDYGKLTEHLKEQCPHLNDFEIQELWSEENGRVMVKLSFAGPEATEVEVLQDSDYADDAYLTLLSAFLQAKELKLIGNGDLFIVCSLEAIKCAEMFGKVPKDFSITDTEPSVPELKIPDTLQGRLRELALFLGPERYNNLVSHVAERKRQNKNHLGMIYETRWNEFRTQFEDELPDDFEGIAEFLTDAPYCDLVADPNWFFRFKDDRYHLYFHHESEFIEVGPCNPEEMLYATSDETGSTFFAQYAHLVNLGFILVRPHEGDKQKRFETWYTNPGIYGEPFTGTMSPNGHWVAYIVIPDGEDAAELHVIDVNHFRISEKPKARAVGYNTIRWIDDKTLEWSGGTESQLVQVGKKS